MILYYVCECCEQVFNKVELAGEGVAEVRGLCTDCAGELGKDESGPSLTSMFYYN